MKKQIVLGLILCSLFTGVTGCATLEDTLKNTFAENDEDEDDDDDSEANEDDKDSENEDDDSEDSEDDKDSKKDKKSKILMTTTITLYLKHIVYPNWKMIQPFS